MRGSIRRERVFRDQSDPLAFSDDTFYKRYRFSAEGICYICKLTDAYVTNATRRSCALTVTQAVYIASHFIAMGTYMHSVGDAENLSHLAFDFLFKLIFFRTAKDKGIIQYFKQT